MPLQIIYGRAGSGKTAACFHRIDRLLENHTQNRIIYIVPEQFSLETEKKILSAFGEKAGGVDVHSFERLCRYVFSRFGPVWADSVDKTGKTMLMQGVLLALEKQLTVLAGAASAGGFSQTALELVGEFKRHNIAPELLAQAADGCQGALKLKLLDLWRIYDAYNRLFSYPRMDDGDHLAQLVKKIQTHNLFSGCDVFIDAFQSFSPAQTGVIEALLPRCRSVTVTLTCDALSPPASLSDVFYGPKLTANRLLALCYDRGIAVSPSVHTGACKKYPAGSGLSHLEAEYFRYPAKVFSGVPSDVAVLQAANYYEEIDLVAEHILRLCREEGYRFRDIAVISKAADAYAPVVRHVFEEYGILYHLDENYTALSHPLPHGVFSLLDALMRGYALEPLLGWLKSPYCAQPEEDIFLLENYLFACGCTPSMWTREQDWTYLPKGFDDEALLRVNEIKNRVRAPMAAFTASFSGRKTVREISTALVDFLHNSGAAQAALENAQEYQMEGLLRESVSETAVWNALIGAIDSMVLAMGERTITFEKYAAVLRAGLQAQEIGQIPPAVDEVTVCSVDRFLSQSAKCVFLTGATNGVFPQSYRTEGLLSDDERESLSGLGVTLAESAALKQINENLVIYQALTGATQRLAVSYPLADNEGAALYPSSVIDRLFTLFPALRARELPGRKADPESSMEGARASFHKMLADREHYPGLRAWLSENNPRWLSRADEALSYSNLPARLSPQTVSLLYGTRIKGSVSRAELFHRCQYAYFLRYGLRARERERHSIDPDNLGSFLHKIIELYSGFASEAGWNAVDADLCREKVAEITKNVLTEQLSEIHLSSARFHSVLKKITRIMSTTAWSITEYYQQSAFVPLGHELSFDENGDLPPISLEVSGREILLRGVVDRADVLQTRDGRFLCVVDYKSSARQVDFSEILCGIQIQLPVYLKAVCDSLSSRDGVKTMPAAMLYYKLDAPLAGAGRDSTDGEIWSEIQKALKMQGLILEHEQVTDSIGGVFAVKAPIAGAQLDRLCETACRQLNRAFSGILAGDIALRPVRLGGKTACDLCPYLSVCGFDTTLPGNSYRNIKKYSREEFFAYAAKMDPPTEAGD